MFALLKKPEGSLQNLESKAILSSCHPYLPLTPHPCPLRSLSLSPFLYSVFPASQGINSASSPYVCLCLSGPISHLLANSTGCHCPQGCSLPRLDWRFPCLFYQKAARQHPLNHAFKDVSTLSSSGLGLSLHNLYAELTTQTSHPSSPQPHP